LRLRIQYQVDRVSICYRNAFMSYIKEILQATSLVEYRYLPLFYFDDTRHNKAPKPYCFAVRFIPDKKRFSEYKEWLYPLTPLTFYFSTSDLRLLVDVYNGAIQKEIYPYNYQKGMLNLDYPKFITLLKDKPIYNNCVHFRTLSPILIEDSQGKPHLPDKDFSIFLKELNYQTDIMLSGVRGKGLICDLQFQPVKLRKEVVKHTIRERNEIPKLYTFTCFSGDFMLYGDPLDLEDIQKLGLGLRRGQGFGMLEVVGGG
jgi:CRISPR-associated endoribonuclease Cas6